MINGELFLKCLILVVVLFLPYSALAKCLALQIIKLQVHGAEQFQIIGFIDLYCKYFTIFKHKRGCSYGSGLK